MKNKKRFIVIWWRKKTKEWRIVGDSSDSYYITREKARELFKNYRIHKCSNEYTRFMYQLEER